jgi:hypothetical protein
MKRHINIGYRSQLARLAKEDAPTTWETIWNVLCGIALAVSGYVLTVILLAA